MGVNARQAVEKCITRKAVHLAENDRRLEENLANLGNVPWLRHIRAELRHFRWHRENTEAHLGFRNGTINVFISNANMASGNV